MQSIQDEDMNPNLASGVLIRRGRHGPIHRGKVPQEDGGRAGGMRLQAKDGRQCQELEETRQDPCPELQRAGSPADTLILDFQPPELGQNECVQSRAISSHRL